MEATSLKEGQRYRITRDSGVIYEGDFSSLWNGCVVINNATRLMANVTIDEADTFIAIPEKSITEIVETGRAQMEA